MSILYINQYAGSPELGMEFRPYYMAKEWNKLGHKTIIICSTYSHLRTHNEYCTGHNMVDGIGYLFLWGNKYCGNGVARFVNIMLFVIQLILISPYLAVKHKPSAVIASSTHLLDIFPAYLISIFSRAKLIFELHDIWPLTLLEIGSMSKYNPFVMLVGFAEWVTYKVADKVISILPDAYKHVKQFGIPKEKFLFVTNGYDFTTAKPEKLPDSLSYSIKNLRKKYKNILAYAGGISRSNATHIILDAAKELNETAIILVGAGTEKELLKNEYSDCKNIIWHDKISKAQVQTFLKSADCSIFALEDSPLYKYGIGLNKIFDYMNAGKPIIQISNLDHTPVAIANCGFCIHISNAKSMAKAIYKALSSNQNNLATLGENGKQFLKYNHDYKYLADKFLNFLEIN
ncbi:MAG: glycosyltransferase family 4 protein [Alphaproteobacteria bacterium]